MSGSDDSTSNATLNKRSTDADVDGMLRYFLASRRSVGNLSPAGELQKAAGLSLMTGSRIYAVSSSTWLEPDCTAVRLLENFENIFLDVPNHVVTRRNGDYDPNRIWRKLNHKSYESNQIPIVSRRIES